VLLSLSLGWSGPMVWILSDEEVGIEWVYWEQLLQARTADLKTFYFTNIQNLGGITHLLIL
jgi:hypothetical protein